MSREKLKKRVRVAAENLLTERGYISPVDLLQKLGYLSREKYEDWRMGRVQYLERVCIGSLGKLSFIMKELKSYAREKDLPSSWTAYKKWGKGKKMRLRFSKSGNPGIEEAYATHYLQKKKDC